MKLVLPTFDLAYLREQIAREEPQISLEQIDARIAAYRNFLALCKAFPTESISPSAEIDTVWHRHILNTKQYHADCASFFGYYLHHNAGIKPTSERGRYSQELFARFFPGPYVMGTVEAPCGSYCTACGPPGTEVTAAQQLTSAQ